MSFDWLLPDRGRGLGFGLRCLAKLLQFSIANCCRVSGRFRWRGKTSELENFHWKNYTFCGARKIAQINGGIFLLRQDPFSLCFKTFSRFDEHSGKEHALLHEDSFDAILTAYPSSDGNAVIVNRRTDRNVAVWAFLMHNGQFKRVIEAKNDTEFFNVDHSEGKWIMSTNSERFGANPLQKECIFQSENRESGNWNAVYIPSQQEELVEATGSNVRMLYNLETNKSRLEYSLAGKKHSIPLCSPASSIQIGSKFIMETTATQVIVHCKSTGIKKYTQNLHKNRYTQETIFTTANSIPITILKLKNPTGESTKNPHFALIDVYGSYGEIPRISITPFIKDLLDDGFVYAFVHVRGGREKGWKWQTGAKGKVNSIKDAQEAILHLCKSGYTSKGKICIHGFSAGAVVAASVFGANPQDFFAVVLDRPLLDVESLKKYAVQIPLSCSDVREFSIEACPMRWLKEASNAEIMVNVMLKDQRVPFWNPLRWLLRSRQVGCRNAMLFFNLEGGHFDGKENDQKKSAFVLEAMGKLDRPEGKMNQSL